VRQILVIGIGAGDPNYVTAQAAQAMNRVDVFFVVDKGQVKDELVHLRKEILDRFVSNPGYRIVELAEPERDRTAEAYESAVEDWHRRRGEIFESAFSTELGEDGVGAFLVWGDPALYDSTLRILDLLTSRGQILFDHEVIPGISSVQALAAKHRLILNRIGEPFIVTTGRRLATGWPAGVNDVVVMLDADCTFQRFLPPKPGQATYQIYWGAYLGTPDQMLISGPLEQVAEQILEGRRAARKRKGWIMDTYLLRRDA
jgi:precorrin-6A synthase